MAVKDINEQSKKVVMVLAKLSNAKQNRTRQLAKNNTIIQIVFFVFTTSPSIDPLFVIMEYISLGKLQTFLRENRRPFTEQRDSFDARSAPLTSTELTQFGYQVAKGMEYIASKVPLLDLAHHKPLFYDRQIFLQS